MLECDVHMTSDGEILISHDSDFLRLCGLKQRIDDTLYDEIPQISREIPLHFSDKKYLLSPEEEGKFMTLRELFELAPH